jgi:hypothetical protein
VPNVPPPTHSPAPPLHLQRGMSQRRTVIAPEPGAYRGARATTAPIPPRALPLARTSPSGANSAPLDGHAAGNRPATKVAVAWASILQADDNDHDPRASDDSSASNLLLGPPVCWSRGRLRSSVIMAAVAADEQRPRTRSVGAPSGRSASAHTAEEHRASDGGASNPGLLGPPLAWSGGRLRESVIMGAADAHEQQRSESMQNLGETWAGAAGAGAAVPFAARPSIIVAAQASAVQASKPGPPSPASRRRSIITPQ